MMINVKIDSIELFRRMESGQRRMAYAVVNAINTTAKRVQRAEIEHVRERFTIRRSEFMFGAPGRPGGAAARIRPFASVGKLRPYAEIGVEPPHSRGLISGRLLLPIFERGGWRDPSTRGASHVAVPFTGGPARPSFASTVPKPFTWAGMRMVAYRGGKRVARAGKRTSRRDETAFGTEGRVDVPFGRSGTQWKGRNRTFIAVPPAKDGEPIRGGVFQRIGPGKHDLRTVYLFRSPMRLHQRMQWLATAQSTADAWFSEDMEREVIKAVAKAAGRTVGTP